MHAGRLDQKGWLLACTCIVSHMYCVTPHFTSRGLIVFTGHYLSPGHPCLRRPDMSGHLCLGSKPCTSPNPHVSVLRQPAWGWGGIDWRVELCAPRPACVWLHQLCVWLLLSTMVCIASPHPAVHAFYKCARAARFRKFWLLSSPQATSLCRRTKKRVRTPVFGRAGQGACTHVCGGRT